MNTEITTSEQAVQVIAGISNTLDIIPVNGKQNISIMAGIYQALNELSKWASSILDTESKEE